MPYINDHFVVSVGSGPYTYTFRVVFALPTLLDSTLVGKLPELIAAVREVLAKCLIRQYSRWKTGGL